jgi:hypothetical protein
MTPHLLLTGCYNVRIVELLFVRLDTFEMRCMSVFAQNCIFRLVYMAAYISACCAGWSLVCSFYCLVSTGLTSTLLFLMADGIKSMCFSAC